MSRRNKKNDNEIKVGALRINTDRPDIVLNIPNLIILGGLIAIAADLILFNQFGEPFKVLGNIRLFVAGLILILGALALNWLFDFESDDKKDTGVRALLPEGAKKRLIRANVIPAKQKRKRKLF